MIQNKKNTKKKALITQKESYYRQQSDRIVPQKKGNYQKVFLINQFPSARNGKVVYIRPEYHERLLRIVQLTREEKTTLYCYIDNILEYHFKEFGTKIIDFFNERNKPIL